MFLDKFPNLSKKKKKNENKEVFFFFSAKATDRCTDLLRTALDHNLGKMKMIHGQ